MNLVNNVINLLFSRFGRDLSGLENAEFKEPVALLDG